MTLHKLFELSESPRSCPGFTGEEINVPSYLKIESFHGHLGMGRWDRGNEIAFFSGVGQSWNMAGLQLGFPAQEGAFCHGAESWKRCQR